MKLSPAIPLLVAAILAGCSTSTVSDAPTPSPASAFSSLKEDMSAAEIHALLGEPAERKPLPTQAGEPPGVIWIYHRTVGENEKQVPIGTRELPLMNPITGQMGTTLEPIYETQKLAVKETVELLMVNDRLLTGKIRRETETQIRPR